MYNIKALDVANFFVNLAIQLEDDSMTNLKINKLLYFAQGACYARLGEPLFEDDMEAWTYGPVAPNVYNTFRMCGKHVIESVSDADYSDDIFPAEVYELLLDVYDEYGKYSASHLVNLSHKQGSPWDCHKGNIIPKKDIKEYFEGNPIKEYQLNVQNIGAVGYRDKDGILVLPKEYDEDGETE